MKVAVVIRVEASSASFAAHHGLAQPAVAERLELEDAVGAGTYGSIHPIRSIGGIPPAPALVAKVFAVDELAVSGGPQPVIDTLTALWDGLDRGADWKDALLAVPYRVLTVSLDGRERLVALMLDLGALGYRAAPLSDLADLRSYRKLPLDARIAYATRLAEAGTLLTAAGFVHGDLNPENLLCNLRTADVQVIDFDSGAVVRTGSERPRTCGKQDDCMPPDLKVPGAPGGVEQSRFTLAAERWSWASLFGFFLFGAHPGFFLAEISPTAIAAYAAAPESWPDIDTNGPLFTKIAVNRSAYAQMLPVFRSVPSQVAALFVQLFDAGADAAARPALADWYAGLSGMTEAPTVEVELLSDAIVLEGDDIVVAWRADNATHVELVPGGRQPAVGSLTLVAREHVRVRVTAFNAFGSETVLAPVVRVMPLPRIERIVLPQLAGFVSTTFAGGPEAQLTAIPRFPALLSLISDTWSSR